MDLRVILETLALSFILVFFLGLIGITDRILRYIFLGFFFFFWIWFRMYYLPARQLKKLKTGD